MRLLTWKPEYSVGIPAVDYEHQTLIDTINRLHDQLEAPDRKQTVPAFFGELLREISGHFALEEKIMRDLGYPRLAGHKEDHEQLLDELRDIMDVFEHSDEVDSVELGTRLESWFSRHFRTHDAQLHKTLEAAAALDASVKKPRRGSR